MRTDQQKQAGEAYRTLGKVEVAAMKSFMKDSVDNRCRPTLWAATSKEVVENDASGQYIVPDKKAMAPSSQAQGDKLAEQLWELSENLLRERIGRLPYESISAEYNVPRTSPGVGGTN